MRANVVKTNFTAGELSPRLYGYTDFEKYSNGAKIIKNLLVYPHGGLTRRPGSQLVNPTKNDKGANSKARLIEFSFSSTQNYVLEFGELYIRFYKAQQQIEDAGSPVEVVTEYTEEQVFELNFVQTADVMFITHPAHPPKELARTSHTVWTFVDIPFTHPPAEWKAGNYPAVVALYQQRMLLAATPAEPQHIWGSKIGDVYEFEIPATIADDSPFIYQIYSNNVNSILWMSTGENITVGTVGAEFALGSTRSGEALTSKNVKVVKETNYGSTVNVAPTRIDNSVLYVATGGRKVREHAFDLYSNGAIGSDTTILSEHITRSGITASTYQNSPDSVFWLLRADGNLIGLTYEKEQKVLAWHHHSLGGDPTTKIISVVSINSTLDPTDVGFAADADELWVVVERTINGEARTFIETMVSQNPKEVAREDLYYLDCGLKGDFATEVTDVGNLDHLEGETVQVLVDGATHPDRVVAGGKITLNSPAKKVHVGYHTDAVVETMPVLEGGNQGEAFMQTKKISRVRLMVYRTLGLKIGPANGDLDWVYMAPGKMDQPPDLVTGVEVEDFPGDYEYEGTIVIKQTQPLPFTLLALVAEYRTQ